MTEPVPGTNATATRARIGTAATLAAAPTVSIGVPAYNGERHLRAAIESLLGQTFEDFELIISDNASIDSTRDICEEFSRRDARVRYHRQPTNIGVARNWNFVARAGRGRYFKWASANDTCEPSMLAQCVKVLDEIPSAVLCYGRTRLIDDAGAIIELYKDDLAVTEDRASYRFRTLTYKLALNNAQSGLIRMNTLRHTRLVRPYIGGDLPLMAEIALLGKFWLLPDYLLNRRISEGSFSRLMSRRELATFWDPTSSSSGRLDVLRLHQDYIASVLRISVPLRDRVASLLIALRSMYWDHGEILRELREWIRQNRSQQAGQG
jgi:glycosyltransferase involved in cell wall biosynthesis